MKDLACHFDMHTYGFYRLRLSNGQDVKVRFCQACKRKEFLVSINNGVERWAVFNKPEDILKDRIDA